MADTYVPSFNIEIEDEQLVSGRTVDVLSVSVTESIESADMFNFSLRDRHTEPGRFAAGRDFRWMDDDVFQEGRSVRIEIGYVGRRREMMDGRVTALAVNFPNSGIPTLNVRGTSHYGRLMRERRRMPFTKGTDSAFAEEVAREVGLESEVDPTRVEYPYHSGAGESLHQMLTRRAQRIGYEVFVKGRTLYFKQPGYRQNPTAALSLEWGRDLMSFRPSLRTHGVDTEVTVRGTQTASGGDKTALVGTASAGDERVRLGARTGSQYAQERLGGSPRVYEDHNVSSQEEANEIALAQLERRSMGYITGRGACIGDPGLMPRKIIEIRGIGEKFSGDYYVTKVTHTVDASGYRCDFEVKRNAR